MIRKLVARLQRKRRWTLPWHQKKWAHWKPSWGTVSALTAVFALLFTGTNSWLTRRSNERDSRAWLVLEKLEMLPLQVGRTITMQSTFKNAGKTPAIHARQGIYTRIVDVPEHLIDGQYDLKQEIVDGFTSGYERRFSWRSVGPQAPGIPYLSLTAINSAPLTQTDLNAFNRWQKVVFVRERFTYEDVFGHEHQTDLCYYSIHLETGENILSQCPNGNDIT